MVCKTCHDMLYEHSGRRGAGTTLHVQFKHHQYFRTVRDSAQTGGCYICRVILEQLQKLITIPKEPSEDEEVRICLIATLRSLPRIGGQQALNTSYRLDFTFGKSCSRFGRKTFASFILLADSDATQNNTQARPISACTSDSKVFDLAKSWIADCAQQHKSTCNGPSKPWYPTRLLEVFPASGNIDPKDCVRVVSRRHDEQQDNQPTFKGKYVTLSHRWGRTNFLKFTPAEKARFQNAIYLHDLPLTFQHAIQFARDLKVRWIWIDALCIVQEDEDDWLRESSTMDKIYTHSYCNISATAATDSSKGLFNKRNPDHDWVQQVTLKGLGGDQDLICTVLDLHFWEKYVDQAPVNERSWVLQERLLAPRVLHWCRDQIAFECRHGNRAECRPEGLPHFQKIRGEIINGARFKRLDVDAGKELRRTRLNKQRSSSDAERLRRMTLELEPRLHYYEVWRRIVETYTKMQLTNDKDRLIALSGIARMMKQRMDIKDTTDEYIAGLWLKGLAGQLLWYVNEADGEEPQPLISMRPEAKYRAPSFSWASVETPRGITFGEITDEGVLISIEMVRLMYHNSKDTFGILTDGYIVIKGTMRRVMLVDKHAQRRNLAVEHTSRAIKQLQQKFHEYTGVKVSKIDFEPLRVHYFLALQLLYFFLGRYLIVIMSIEDLVFAIIVWVCITGFALRPALLEEQEEDKGPDNPWSWRLMKEGEPVGSVYDWVYLDSPASEPSVFGKDGNVFIIPALKTEDHITCMLVQAAYGDYGVRYKRIGLTKISRVHKQEVEDIITPPGRREISYGRYFWPKNQRSGENTICII